jgi:hypothetical protein
LIDIIHYIPPWSISVFGKIVSARLGAAVWRSLLWRAPRQDGALAQMFEVFSDLKSLLLPFYAVASCRKHQLEPYWLKRFLSDKF